MLGKGHLLGRNTNAVNLLQQRGNHISEGTLGHEHHVINWVPYQGAGEKLSCIPALLEGILVLHTCNY